MCITALWPEDHWPRGDPVVCSLALLEQSRMEVQWLLEQDLAKPDF